VLMCLVIYGIFTWSQTVLLILATIYVSSGLFIRIGGLVRRVMRPKTKPPEAQLG
jgi:CDP-diacylglycerol--serine O-phosphatidyltransferase